MPPGHSDLLQCMYSAFKHMETSVRALALLGLLDFPSTSQDIPQGIPTAVERRGHWQIEHHAEAAVWRCLCSRSEPLVVPRELMSRVTFLRGLFEGCEVCRNDLQNANSKAGLLRAWLERNRPLIDDKQHFELPDVYVWTDKEEAKSVRVLRFVYEAFWEKRLSSSDCVSRTCSHAFCINPYHLCVNTNFSAKVTDRTRSYILRLTEEGIRAQTIKTLLREQHSLDLSLSTIHSVRRSGEKIKNSVCSSRS